MCAMQYRNVDLVTNILIYTNIPEKDINIYLYCAILQLIFSMEVNRNVVDFVIHIIKHKMINIENL